MTALPAASDFTGSVTEAQFKTAMTDLRTFLATLLAADGTAASARAALGLVLQGSAYDNTAGRLLTVGAFGLGAASIVGQTAPGNDLNNAAINGWFDIDTSTTNKPSGFGTGVCRVEVRGAPARVVQTALQVAGATIVKKWTRVSYGTTPDWGSWLEDYNQGSVIGIVSQSGGVPTGKLIEKGNNANGYFRKFACGKMECWHVKAASSGAAATWTFPSSAFIEAPVVTGTAVATVSSTLVLDAAPSTTAATFSARDKTDARRADPCHLRAVGRWSDLT